MLRFQLPDDGSVLEIDETYAPATNVAPVVSEFNFAFEVPLRKELRFEDVMICSTMTRITRTIFSDDGENCDETIMAPGTTDVRRTCNIRGFSHPRTSLTFDSSLTRLQL